MTGVGGVTSIEASVAALTVSAAAGAVTPPRLAVTSVEPAPAEVARPLEPAALLILATVLFVEFQVTTLVRSCVEPSV